MITLVTPIILFVVIVAAVYFFYKGDKAQLTHYYITLGITLVGTFVGLYSAVYFNDRRKIRDEKRQVEALVKQTIKDIDGIIDYGEHFKRNIPERAPNAAAWIDANPVRESLMLEKLLSSELFSKYCIAASPYLFTELSNTQRAFDRINDSKVPQELRVGALNIYILELRHIKDLLDNSLRLLDGSKGEKDFEELDEKWRKKKTELLPSIKDVVK